MNVMMFMLAAVSDGGFRRRALTSATAANLYRGAVSSGTLAGREDP